MKHGLTRTRRAAYVATSCVRSSPQIFFAAFFLSTVAAAAVAAAAVAEVDAGVA